MVCLWIVRRSSRWYFRALNRKESARKQREWRLLWRRFQWRTPTGCDCNVRSDQSENWSIIWNNVQPVEFLIITCSNRKLQNWQIEIEKIDDMQNLFDRIIKFIQDYQTSLVVENKIHNWLRAFRIICRIISQISSMVTLSFGDGIWTKSERLESFDSDK